MARVERLPATVPSRPAATSNDMAPVSKSRKHKVVLESVTQEKKKLRQMVSFDAKAPPGYTFIPAGNPELTTALKEASRKANSQVYTVSTTPHANVHDLSQQVHRMGYHFSSLIVAEVCHQYGIQLTATGHIVGGSYETFLKDYKGRVVPGAEEDAWDQTTLNTKARDAIKDLFPNIPDNDLFQIIKTAFQKGKRRVGTASELPLARRAQLAVVAHIRHCYTDYDKLLRSGGYHDARGVVEKPTLAKLVEWRGDDENGAKILEDVFREVVLISDDEDSDDDDYDPEAPLQELSVEVVTKNVNPQSQQIRSDPHGRASGHPGDPLTLSDDDAPSGVQYVSQRHRRHHDPQQLDRRGYSAWNAAREQYRADPQRQIAPNTHYAPAPVAFRSISGPNANIPYEQSRPREPLPLGYLEEYSRQAPISSQRRQIPETIRGADGTIYTRINTPPHPGNGPPAQPSPRSNAAPYDPSRPLIPEHLQRPPPPLSMRPPLPSSPKDPYARESDIALPSIEEDQIPFKSNQPANDSNPPSQRDYRTTPPNYRQPRDIVDLTNTSERPAVKKRRYDDSFEPTSNGEPPSRILRFDANHFSDPPIRRLERADLNHSPRGETYRGRDRINDDRPGQVSHYDSVPNGRNPFEHVHSHHSVSQDPPRSSYPIYSDPSRDHVYVRTERDDPHHRPPYLLPQNSRALDTASAPPVRSLETPIEIRSGNARYEPSGRQPQPYHERKDPGRVEPQRLPAYNPSDGLGRPIPQRAYASADDRLSYVHSAPAGSIPRHDGPSYPPPDRRVYGVPEPSRDPLPRRMEQLVVDKPIHPYGRYEDVSRVRPAAAPIQVYPPPTERPLLPHEMTSRPSQYNMRPEPYQRPPSDIYQHPPEPIHRNF